MNRTICRSILGPAVLGFLIAGSLAFTPRPATAAEKYLVATVGTKQGSIKGTSKVKGHEEWLDIESVDVGGVAFAVENEVALRRNAASGMASGKRQHKPITIVREVDAASPLIWSALVSNEGFKTITVECANGNHILRLTVTGGTMTVKRVGPHKEVMNIAGGVVTYN